MKRFSIHVQGKVQGVFFRASAKEQADALHIRGTVRNNADGSLAIEAEGEEENLMRFISWCKKGPPLSRVVSFEIKEGRPKGMKSFSIEH